MRSYGWMRLWWECCRRAGDELFVLSVRDRQGTFCALLPWYRQRHRWLGRVLRWLGDRVVATDHLELLAQGPAVPEAIASLARFLEKTARGSARRPEALWDLIHLESVPCAAGHTLWLLQRLQSQGFSLWWRPDQGHWQLPLPASWEELLARLSKSHRKQLRRLKRRYFDSGRVSVCSPGSPEQLEHAFRLLVALHQKRWQSQGEPGCFASGQFTRFHRKLVQQCGPAGPVRLWHLMLDGKAVAAEYQFAAPGGWMLYQGGLDPGSLEHEPGRLALVHTLLQAIEQGVPVLDFLRGDEPYKAHIRAIRYPCAQIRVLAPSALARLRHAGYLGAHRAKGLLKPRPENSAGAKASSAEPDRRWRPLSEEELARWLCQTGPSPLVAQEGWQSTEPREQTPAPV